MEIKAKKTGDMSLEDMAILVSWCECQDADLWEGMRAQDILNVYHVSHEWDTFDGWVEEEGNMARKAWNSVVKDKDHHLALT